MRNWFSRKSAGTTAGSTAGTFQLRRLERYASVARWVSAGSSWRRGRPRTTQCDHVLYVGGWGCVLPGRIACPVCGRGVHLRGGAIEQHADGAWVWEYDPCHGSGLTMHHS